MSVLHEQIKAVAHLSNKDTLKALATVFLSLKNLVSLEVFVKDMPHKQRYDQSQYS